MREPYGRSGMRPHADLAVDFFGLRFPQQVRLLFSRTTSPPIDITAKIFQSL
jgi:hypothetical protein